MCCPSKDLHYLEQPIFDEKKESLRVKVIPHDDRGLVIPQTVYGGNTSPEERPVDRIVVAHGGGVNQFDDGRRNDGFLGGRPLQALAEEQERGPETLPVG